jgi:hypothetical protein
MFVEQCCLLHCWRICGLRQAPPVLFYESSHCSSPCLLWFRSLPFLIFTIFVIFSLVFQLLLCPFLHCRHGPVSKAVHLIMLLFCITGCGFPVPSGQSRSHAHTAGPCGWLVLLPVLLPRLVYIPAHWSTCISPICHALVFVAHSVLASLRFAMPWWLWPTV